MKGSIRLVLGLLIVFGAVGVESNLVAQLFVSCAGLMLMKSGCDALKNVR